jgi:hypothetical protein
MRNLRTDLRDRLHALAALIETRTGQKTTMERVVNEAIDRGVRDLEAEWFSPKTATKIAARNGTA